MINLLPFAGILLAVVIGGLLSPIFQGVFITPVLMILIPVYIMYRQLDSQLDKLNASKTDCVEESDLQELLKDSMKQAAEAFSQKIFCEEFVDAVSSMDLTEERQLERLDWILEIKEQISRKEHSHNSFEDFLS